MALTKVSRGLLSTGIVDNSTTTAITIDSSENVGIGTSSPQKTLDVKGTFAISNSTTSYWNFDRDDSDGSLTIADTGTERMRIDSSGNVDIGGVGNISPYGIRFAINGTGTGGAGLYFGSGVIIPTDNTPTISDANVDLGASNYRFKDLYLSGKASMTALEPGVVTITSGSYFVGNTSAGYRFNNAADTSNLMILKDNGALLLSQTVENGIGGTPADVNGTEIGKGYINLNRDDTASATQIQFGKNGSHAGRIVTTTTTSYLETSDRRVKSSIADADDCGTAIDSMQVRKFDWVDSGVHHPFGMIAQELLEIAPIAVHAPEDSEEMMGIDYSKLVPMLVKEIQSLRSRVAELENN